MFIAITFGIILFLVSYYSERLFIQKRQNRVQIKSFAAGVILTYIFLELIPRSLPDASNVLFFFYILLGFATFHVLEKYIYQHAEGTKLKNELKEEHLFVFVLYHIVIGIVLVFLLKQSYLEGLFFFLPIVLHDIVSSAALRHIYEPIKMIPGYRIALAGTTMLGIFIGFFLPFSPHFYGALIGFLAGTLLHWTARDVIPQRREGTSLYFILGMLTMIGFLTITFV